MTFLPYGVSLVLACNGDNSIRLMDYSSSMIKKSLTGYEDFLNAVVYDPLTDFVFSASDDGTVRAWDLKAETGKIIFKSDGYMKALAVSSAKKWVVAGGKDGMVRVHGLHSLEKVKESEFNSPVHALAFDASGKYLVIGTLFDIYLLDVEQDIKVNAGNHVETVTAVYWLKEDSLAFVSLSTAKEIFRYKLAKGMVTGTAVKTVPVEETVAITAEVEMPFETVDDTVFQDEEVVVDEPAATVIDPVAIEKLLDDLDDSIEGMMEFQEQIVGVAIDKELVDSHFESVKLELLQVKHKLAGIVDLGSVDVDAVNRDLMDIDNDSYATVDVEPATEQREPQEKREEGAEKGKKTLKKIEFKF